MHPHTPARRRGDARTAALLLALSACLLVIAAIAPSALAHAQLQGTSPVSGSTVAREPSEVIFKFNQNVGGTLGAVRVYNAQGEQVDDLDVSHPEAQEHWMGVGLKPGLPDGTYTATYRVISADTHIVYGGLVFNLGHAGTTPKFTVASLIEKNKSGEATEVAFGVVRGLDYITIALLLGGLVFVLAVWLPGFAAVAGSEAEWQQAARGFAARMRRLLGVAVVLGVIVSALGILLQGAAAAGVSLWSSLKSTILQNTLESRFGEVWGLRAIDWLALGAGACLSRRAGDRSRWLALDAPIAVRAAYLVATPALSGHASIQSPTGVFFPSDVLHVLAASVWVGGIACLLLALPAATRRLAGQQRSRLLLAVLARFSPLALAAVIAIAATGVLQAYIDVRSLHGLLHSTYGALIIAKTVLLLALICLGWVNRGRLIPALKRIAAAEQPPGRRGRAGAPHDARGARADARRVRRDRGADQLRAADRRRLGSVLDQHHARPGRAGDDRGTGPKVGPEHGAPVPDRRQDRRAVHCDEGTDRHGQAAVKGIGPLALKANLAGPGHYVLGSAVLSPGGTWEIEITDRVSEFEQFSHTREGARCSERSTAASQPVP